MIVSIHYQPSLSVITSHDQEYLYRFQHPKLGCPWLIAAQLLLDLLDKGGLLLDQSIGLQPESLSWWTEIVLPLGTLRRKEKSLVRWAWGVDHPEKASQFWSYLAPHVFSIALLCPHPGFNYHCIQLKDLPLEQTASLLSSGLWLLQHR